MRSVSCFPFIHKVHFCKLQEYPHSTSAMRRSLLLLFLTAMGLSAYPQDFSNKGKDFWIGYANHVRMYTSQVAQQEKMSLYITSDVSTTGTVEIPGIGFNQTFTITANQISIIDIPRTARLNGDGLFNLGIHVTSARPVVVYAHICPKRLGATVCLPTTTLGKNISLLIIPGK
jgi:hypothetical protein